MADTNSGQDTRASLLVRIRDAQDTESWQTFVDLYGPLVYRYARRHGLQDADAADATQEVLARVAKSMRTFEYQPERGRFRDWLGMTTRNVVIRLLSKSGREKTGEAAMNTLCQLPAAEADGDWTSEFNAQVLRVGLERIRKSFEPGTWRAFEGVWLLNKPAQELATELGLHVEMVYVAKSRVLKRLREEILLLAQDIPAFVPLS